MVPSAYEKGADGKLALWALKQYKGHQMLSKEDILTEYNKTDIN